MPDESQSEHDARMVDDGAGAVDTDAQIQANIADAFGTLGTVVTDVGNIPTDASLRPNGRFTDAHDAEEYLERGGLVLRDDAGNTIPFPWVYFLSYFDEILEETVYEVHISEDTN